MAARHFAQGDWELETLQGEDEDELTEGSSRHGRHFKQPAVVYEPPKKVSSFVVPVPADADADARARARIEEIMAELDALMHAEAEPEPEAVQEPVVEHEPDLGLEIRPEPESEPEPEPAPEDSSDLEPVLEPEAEPVPAEPAVVPAPEPEPVLEPVPASVFSDDLGEIDEPLFDDLDDVLDPSFAWEVEQLSVAAQTAKASEADSQTNADEDLDATAKLDRVAERLASEVVDDEVVHDQSYISDRSPEKSRLEAMTDLSVPKSVPETVTTLVPVKRRLGFFAAIGAFIARLFHMDDR